MFFPITIKSSVGLQLQQGITVAQPQALALLANHYRSTGAQSVEQTAEGLQVYRTGLSFGLGYGLRFSLRQGPPASLLFRLALGEVLMACLFAGILIGFFLHLRTGSYLSIALFTVALLYLLWVLNIISKTKNEVQQVLAPLQSMVEESLTPLQQQWQVSEGNCPACGALLSPYRTDCPDCGLPLKRKARINPFNQTAFTDSRLVYHIIPKKKKKE